MVYLKLFRAVWFVSLLVVLSALLYGYAMLPGMVIVQQEGGNILDIERDTFFYLVLGLLAGINVLVYLIAWASGKKIAFRTWFYGLIICFNAFFIIGIAYIALYNSHEAYDYHRLEPIIYGSVVLFLIWAIAWPIYLGGRLILNKS